MAELKASLGEWLRPVATQAAKGKSVLTLICFYLLLFYFILSLRGGSLVNRGAIFVSVFIHMKPDT